MTETVLVREIGEADVDAEVAVGPVVVEFFATWCGVCRRLAPVLDRVAAGLRERADFVKVNVDESAGLVARFGISATPTLLVFDAGAAVGRPLLGAHPENVVREAITDALALRPTRSGELSWVPTEACTLPTAEQPLRVAEFADLFTRSLRGIDRVSTTRLRLGLDTNVEARARDLAARETGCCSFFTFDFTPAGTDGVMWMDVSVSTERAGVLDGLASHAAGAFRGAGR